MPGYTLGPMRQGDDSQIFERLLQPHLDRLYRLAWRLAGEKERQPKICSRNCSSRYSANSIKLVEIEEPGPWLGRVMYNLFIDERRRFARQRLHMVGEGALAGDGLAGLPGPGDPVAERGLAEQRERLGDALERLSDEHRVVVLLHDAEGYKLNEIQDLTGTPVGTLKSRLHRARARLRELLEANGTFS